MPLSTSSHAEIVQREKEGRRRKTDAPASGDQKQTEKERKGNLEHQ